MLRECLHIIFCLLLTELSSAQDEALAAVKKICAAYNSRRAVSFNGSISMYNKANPAVIIERIQSRYSLQGTKFICSIGAVTMLVNDRYYVSVDKSVKLMMIGRKEDLSGTGQMPVLNTRQFKSWITEKRIEASLIPAGAVSVLQLMDKTGATGYNSYRITYDEVTGYMKKAVLETAAPDDPQQKTMVLDITYSKPVAVKNGFADFSAHNFFSIENNKIRVRSAFKNYQIINQLQNHR